MKTAFCLFILTLWSVLIIADDNHSIKKLPRYPFEIQLANLSATINQKSGECEKVRITYPDSKDQVIITATDDIFLRFTRHGTEKTIYREDINYSYKISDFELKHLKLVSKTLLETLEEFEKDLQSNRWGKCLYLDSYLPRFLKGYYHLFCLAMNTTDVLPESVNVADSLYDISLNSDKSDMRLYKWKTTNDYIVKLRIATKELIHQIGLWQQEISKKEKNHSEITVSREFARSLGLFASIYFNESFQPKKSQGKR
ncbi:MAG: hypothetical protein GX267_13940 [Fibrobacter sp.]|nr:hypothetical protein [Fibrobacter sp.]